MLLSFQRFSLKNQQILTAITASFSAFIAVFLILKLSIQLSQQASILLPYKLPGISLSAAFTAIVVGVTTFALESITINQIERGLHQLRSQFRDSIGNGFNLPEHLDRLVFPKELKQTIINFNQMKLAVSTRLREEQQKLEEQAIIKDNLQSQLTRLQQALEKAIEQNQKLEEQSNKKKEEIDEPEGEVGDFIAQMQTEFQEEPKSVASLTSSSPEEIRQYKDELEYRIVWLRTLLEDAEKELKLICITYQL